MNTAHRTLPFLLALLTAGGAAHAGEVVLKDGKVITGDIKGATYETVKFTIGSSLQQRRADEVARIYPSGDGYLDRAIKLLKSGDADPSRLERALEQAVQRGSDEAKPCAQFFLGELYERYGKGAKAVEAYDAVASGWKQHFYAPMALERAAGLSKGGEAAKRLDRLASGEFGASWRDSGAYGKARILLGQKQADAARKEFAKLTSSSDRGLQSLAKCGEAHCRFLSGDKSGAERIYRDVLRDSGAPTSAKGYAWKGIGDCEADKPDEALLAYLRAVLLYPSNPERASAARDGADLLQKQGLGGEARLRGLAGGVQADDYAGDHPEAELMRRCMQFVSAFVVQKYAEELAKKARANEERADLEFLAADALKVIARAKNDPAMLAQYEDKLRELRKKYPNHDRASLATIDAFMAAKDRALAIIGQAKDEPDDAKREELQKEGRDLFEKVIEPFKGTVADMTKKVEQFAEKDERGELSEQEQQEKQELEFQRDLCEFLLAEAHSSYAQTFEESDAAREENFKKALELYDNYIAMRGNFQKLLFYSYIGRGEMLMELKRYDDAIMQFEELTFVEPMFVPEDPEGRKAVLDMVKDVAIRAYYGWTRALMAGGKAKEAFEASQQIDQNPKCEGWRDHPMGILLTFERSKALAGAGRGAQGAKELYAIIADAKKAPDAEKIPALGMSRVGAGACRALSELSDLTGGEIYSPEVQYYVGVGYFLRRRTELAIAGYKGVLTSAHTPKEREEWVPLAVREIGNLLFQQERYLEAALAYQTVFTEFPKHELADQAVRFAISASKKAIEQFGEDPTSKDSAIAAFSARIERSITESDVGGPEYTAKLILNEAKDLHVKQRWLQAAQSYLRIPEWAEQDGKKTRISFFPNAVANAGYCFFQAYREKKDEQHLKAAKEALGKAVKVGGEMNDRESQALASFYLGQLENQLGNPDKALDALKPFDGPLSDTARYIVRARFEQATAALAQGKPDSVSRAEAYFAKVADKTSDEFFEKFAYALANELRTAAIKTYNETRELPKARQLRQKSARYAKHWADSTKLDEARDVVVLWVAGLLFDGGLYRDAARLFELGLKKSERPKLDGRDERAYRQNLSLDLAELQLGYAQMQMGDHEKAMETLDRVRRTVYVKGKEHEDKNDNAFMRGTIKPGDEGRQLKGPFSFKREGRQVSRKVWFTNLDVGGETVTFFDVDPPRGGDSEFYAVQGTDAAKIWQPGDWRRLEIPLKRDYLVVDGLARAAWELYQQNKDPSFLANKVTETLNELRYVLRGMDEGSYLALVAGNQLEPTDHSLRSWEADVTYLRLKMARESWGEVLGDLKQMELLGSYQKAPPQIKQQLDAIKAEAESKS